MTSWTYEATQAGYLAMWKSAQLRPADVAKATAQAKQIVAGEARYKTVSTATNNIPWFFIGALHMLEAGGSFEGVLQNGDKIIGTGQRTTHEPVGEGPFATWEDSAIQAMKDKNFQRVASWPVQRDLYSGEVYNGLAYVSHGENSPYVWGGTNHEQTGKYIADHVFSSTAESTQIGVAGLFLALAQLRPDVAAALEWQPTAGGIGQALPAAPPVPAIPASPAAVPAAATPAVVPAPAVIVPAPAPTIDLTPLVNVLVPLVKAAGTPQGITFLETVFAGVAKYMPELAAVAGSGVLGAQGLGAIGAASGAAATPAGVIATVAWALPLALGLLNRTLPPGGKL